MPPLFDATGLFRVHPSGIAERVVTRAPRRPRFQVTAGGEASKLPPRAPTRPILHPTRGHVGQTAPASVLDRLSVPEDPEATIGRFARATRRQNVEFHATVHPLSGRMMGLARGNEIGVAGDIRQAMTPNRRRLLEFHDRHRQTRPELARRAMTALQRQGPIAGPRPIVVHNHPLFAGGHTRHMPSAADTGSLLGPGVRQQNRVISLVPHAPRGAPKTHETSFGLYPGSGRADYGAASRAHERQAAQLNQIDAETAPPSVLQDMRRRGFAPLPLQRRMHGATRAEYARQARRTEHEHVEGVLGLRGTGRFTGERVTPIGSSYDDLARGITQPTRKTGVSQQDFARRGGFYSRERFRKSAAQRKAFGAFVRAARNPRYMLAAHPSGVATGGVAAAAAVAPHHTDRGRKIRDATIGAVAGKGGYQLVGHSVKATARRNVQWHARMSDLPADTPEQQERKYQIKQEQKMRGRWQREHGGRPTGAAYRDFPLGMTTGEGRYVPHRLGRVFRALGHTHGGRSGTVLSNAAGVTGAVIGYRHARHDADRVGFGKSAQFGYQTKQTHPVRAAEMTAGAALTGYGVPRLAMTGHLIEQGAKLVERYGGADAAAAALKAAQAARGTLTAATAPLAQLKSYPRIGHAVEAVPAAMRPAVATVAGILLMDRAHPVRQRTFVPVGG